MFPGSPIFDVRISNLDYPLWFSVSFRLPLEVSMKAMTLTRVVSFIIQYSFVILGRDVYVLYNINAIIPNDTVHYKCHRPDGKHLLGVKLSCWRKPDRARKGQNPLCCMKKASNLWCGHIISSYCTRWHLIQFNSKQFNILWENWPGRRLLSLKSVFSFAGSAWFSLAQQVRLRTMKENKRFILMDQEPSLSIP